MNNLSSPIDATKRWLEAVVIGLNFCPFAKKEFDRHSIRYTLDSSQTESAALNVLIDELCLLDKEPAFETSLLIYDKAFTHFDDYLNLLSMATNLIEQSGYRGIYQLASFHPDYCFEGESENDAANYTNRSPYPLIHILREASLAKVVKNISDPEAIPNRNIIKARELGIEALQALLS